MKKSLFSTLLFFCAAAAAAGQLDPKFDSIAAQFARDAAARSIDLAASPAAVFPYGCDEKLAKKRVDVAVGELFTARLLRGGSFKLLERAQLDQVMKEQALSLSGAIDSATAAQVGKLAGARLAILGTVARVGKAYQISSKLVDAQSAEIISASIIEVPLETFDEEAARYLVLVPEREALGLYLGTFFWPVKTKSLPPVTVANSGGAVVTPRPEETALWGVTVGVRYQVAQKWFADLAVMPAVTLGSAAKYTVTGQLYSPPTGTIDGEGARLSINRVSRFSNKFRSVYGLGYQIYGFQPYSEGTGQVPAGSTYLNKPTGGSTIYGAFARGGLEYRPTERFALALFGQLNQGGAVKAEWEEKNSLQKVKVMELDLPVFILDTTFAFYF